MLGKSLCRTCPSAEERAWAFEKHGLSNPHNKTAHKLAKHSARQATRNLGRPVVVRREQTSQPTQLGSVEMLGQRLTIRTVTAESVPLQTVSRYRYEAMSRRSPFYGCIHFAFSDDPMLRPHHAYYVRMGTDAGYPQITRCFGEKTDSAPS